MDCLSIPDSGTYDCSNRWGVNCTNSAGFDFVTIANITQKIQQYCPTDPRLFLSGNTPATAENAALTGQACKAIAGSQWQHYPGGDIWVRLTTWKFPLLQLVASSPRPPLGWKVESFVILHLLGDPIGTIKDLLRVISNCQTRADRWRRYLSDGRLEPEQVEHAWKAFTIISISYDEWGKGNEVHDILRDKLDSLLLTRDSLSAISNSPQATEEARLATSAAIAELKVFLDLTNLTADALAADRATQFLPILVAQGFFVGAIGVAIAKITSTSPLPASLFINIEAHSIAFSALYFWILPAVFLSSIIGVSQTASAVPRILRRLQTGFDLELRQSPAERQQPPEQQLTQIPLPKYFLESQQSRALYWGQYSRLPNQLELSRPPEQQSEIAPLPNSFEEDEQRRLLNGEVYSGLPTQPEPRESPTQQQSMIALPNYSLKDEQRRILHGGVYSWLPNQPEHYESTRPGALLQRNALPILLVVSGTATAMLVSGYVPPAGWQPRHCAQASLLLVWLCSFALTSLLKRPAASKRYNESGRFWLTFAKDLLAVGATMGGIVVTQVGVFHRCDSYSRWDRVALALPGSPDVAAVLERRIGSVYPAIVFVSIGLQMFVVPVVIAIWYRHALWVFLQRDDDGVGFWQGWKWPSRFRIGGKRRGTSAWSKMETGVENIRIMPL